MNILRLFLTWTNKLHGWFLLRINCIFRWKVAKRFEWTRDVRTLTQNVAVVYYMMMVFFDERTHTTFNSQHPHAMHRQSTPRIFFAFLNRPLICGPNSILLEIWFRVQMKLLWVRKVRAFTKALHTSKKTMGETFWLTEKGLSNFPLNPF